jgi:hypothetical protein
MGTSKTKQMPSGDTQQGLCPECYDKVKDDRQNPETETIQGECANCGKQDVGVIPWIPTPGPTTLL